MGFMLIGTLCLVNRSNTYSSIKKSFLRLHNSFAGILSSKHADESIEHILKTIGDSFPVLDLSFLEPLEVLFDTLVPAGNPSVDQETFHLQLIEDKGRLKNSN